MTRWEVVRKLVAMVLGMAWACALPSGLWAKVEKPTTVAEDFFRCLRLQSFSEAAELLSAEDKQSFAALQEQKQKADPKAATKQTLEDLLKDTFFLLNSEGEGLPGANKKMAKKAEDGETIMPQNINFFVPGQYYIVGNYAAVFTRETYAIAKKDTGPVRDDPRKLWVDPTNALSKVRDEAYFKQWWVWEENNLIMPGLIWMVKQNNEWHIDLFAGAVPRAAFRKILRWHFGRDVFEEEKPAEKTPTGAQPGAQPSPPPPNTMPANPPAPVQETK